MDLSVYRFNVTFVMNIAKENQNLEFCIYKNSPLNFIGGSYSYLNGVKSVFGQTFWEF